MHSPLASPSVPLRAMAYVHSPHPHLPRSSYFSPVVQGSPPPAPRYPTNAASYPTRQQPAQHSPAGTSPYAPPSSPRTAPSPGRPLMPARRNSFRESAIPIHPPTNTPMRSSKNLGAMNESGGSRRRPSFKIDLPPRPIPVEILRSVHTLIHTPYPTKAGNAISLAQKTANNTALNAHTPPAHYCAVEYGSNSNAAVNRERGSTFCEAPGEEYIILQPSPDLELDRHRAYDADGTAMGHRHDPASPMADPWSGAGIIGLGYTLNKLRAPTPWIRGKGEEGEWLTSSDIEEVQVRTSGLGMA